MYGQLLDAAGGRERLLHYFTRVREERPPGDPEVLAAEKHRAKVDELEALIRAGELASRPSVLRLLDELGREGIASAVATTGTRSTVLDLLLGLGAAWREGFVAMLTADEAPRKKPDPEVYEMALAELGVRPHEASAIEDSRNGLLAARAAGIPCLVTVSDYSAGESFDGADLVVENLGEPDAPAAVLRDPHHVTSSARSVIRPPLLETLSRRASWR